jgi:predicted ATP-grasp superfamily ATP-dependent carboligase
VARVGISTDRQPEVERLTEELLTRSNYRGYFSNEFKLDPRDGQFKLIENNCRMPRSGMLAIAAGVNFPWLMYQDLVLNQQCDITEYKVGTYWIDFWTDLYNSLFRRKKEDIRLRDYVGPYFARDKVFSDFDFEDLKPFFRVAYQVITSHDNAISNVAYPHLLALSIVYSGAIIEF